VRSVTPSGGTTTRVNGAREVVCDVGTMLPGESVSLTVRVMTEAAGTLTSEVFASAANDGNPANNAATQSMVVTGLLSRPFTSLRLEPKQIAFDPETLQIVLLSPAGSDGEVWFFDPEALRLAPPVILRLSWLGTSKLAVARQGGNVFIHRLFGAVDWLDTRTLNVREAFGFAPLSCLYLDVSPIDLLRVAFGTSAGSSLVAGPHFQPQTIDHPGQIAFSEDGRQLYCVDYATCSFETYRVEPTGFVFESRVPVQDCSGFRIRDGRAYFDSGTILDASTGQQIGPGLSMSPPSLVLPRTRDTMDVVSRIAGKWTLRRVTVPNLDVLESLELSLTDPPLELAEAGRDRVAIRTSGPSAFDFHLADFRAGKLNLDIRMLADRRAGVRFETTASTRYRLEQRNEAATGAWEQTLEPVTGAGGPLELEIGLSAEGERFFRLVQLPETVP